MVIRRVVAILVLFTIIVIAALLALAATQEIVTSIFVPHDCILSLQMSDATTCAGADMSHLTCKGIKLKLIDKCEEVRVDERGGG